MVDDERPDEAADAVEASEVTEAAAGAGETPEPAEGAGTPEAHETAGTPEAHETAGTVETSAAPETHETSAAHEVHEAAEPPEPSDAPGGGIGRTVTVISLRVVRGLAGMASAAALIAAVGLVPLPTIGVTPLGTPVEPQPADLLALCPGGALRLGDETGADAGQAFAVGSAELTVVADGGTPARTTLTAGAVGDGSSEQAPTLLRLAPSGTAALAATQTQWLDGEGGLRGLAIAGCTEPTSSAWLVGGATTVGRTTLLLLANPTAVEAEVSVRMWGESGPVTAPGMKGIAVPANGQRVLALSGFAPDLASPVVHVEARGGQVVAALQTSVTRVLDPGGLDLVSAGAAPADHVVIPAVRIADAAGVGSSLGLEDHADLEAIVRIGNPGEATADVEVSVSPTFAGGVATSFHLHLSPGQVTDIALSTALELGAEPFTDGSYTVTLESNAPVVAAVRSSTIPAPTTDADGDIVPGGADLAWFASAPRLTGDVALAVADAPGAVLVAAAKDGAVHTVTLTPIGGGDPLTVEVPGVGSVALPVESGAGYLVRGTRGVAIALSFADQGALAGYPLRSPRAADSMIVVRP